MLPWIQEEPKVPWLRDSPDEFPVLDDDRSVGAELVLGRRDLRVAGCRARSARDDEAAAGQRDQPEQRERQDRHRKQEQEPREQTADRVADHQVRTAWGSNAFRTPSPNSVSDRTVRKRSAVGHSAISHAAWATRESR